MTDVGSGSCVRCDQGKYNDQTGMTLEVAACKMCVPGKYNELYNRPSVTDCIACGLGKFMVNTTHGATHRDSCNNCAKGKYEDEEAVTGDMWSSLSFWANEGSAETAATSTDHNTNCKVCPIGTYSNSYGRSSLCGSCPRGRYGNAKMRTHWRECPGCPVGYYQNQNRQTLCIACAKGRYTDEIETQQPLHTYTGAHKKCKGCPVGRYGDEVASTRPLNADIYPSGPMCKACKLGQYGNEIGLPSYDACKFCIAGRFSVVTELETVEECAQCQSGFYGTELGCFKERGSNNNGEPFLLLFDTPETLHLNVSARFCNNSCTDCPKGKYSTAMGANNLDTCIDCPVGLYLDTTGANKQSDCKPCPSGRYGLVTGIISAKDTSAASTCTSCGAGRYNPTTGGSTTSVCAMCPLGKWSTKTNDDIFDGNPLLTWPYADSVDDCLACPPGRFGATPGLVEADSTKGSGTSTYCTACDAGKYLPLAGQIVNYTSDCIPCGVGKYLPHTGATSENECKDCHIGFYSNEIGRKSPSTTLGICSRMQINNNSFPTSPMELIPSVAACSDLVPCTLPSFCVYSTAACKGCPIGTYIDITGQDSALDCKDCPVGKYGQAVGAFQQGSVSNAPHFCKYCPAGFYSGVTGITNYTDCNRCGKGRYSEQQGMATATAACQLCRPGKYSDLVPTYDDPIIQQECKWCTAGKVNPIYGRESFADCVDCPAGKYNPFPRMSQCANCPTGFYTSEEGGTNVFSHCKQCGLGRYSDTTGGNSSLHGCKRCPLGKYSETFPAFGNPVRLDECVDCPGGRFGRYEGLTAADSGTGAFTNTYCDACPSGKYLEEIGAISATACVDCSIGKYLMSTGM